MPHGCVLCSASSGGVLIGVDEGAVVPDADGIVH